MAPRIEHQSSESPGDSEGTLYVVPTPIGNLEDITLRAIRILGTVPLVAAEDTRRARILLNHLKVKPRVISYHQHNKNSGIQRVLSALTSHDVALISDAGMPAIADPGFELISAALSEGIHVEVLPGPSVVPAAFVAAQIPAPGFVFIGYLPRRKREIVQRLSQVMSLPDALILFEAPHRIAKTMTVLLATLGERECVVIRELSKLHEEIRRTTLSSLLSVTEGVGQRGEWTLVIAGSSDKPTPPPDEEIVEAIRQRMESASTREVVEQVATELGVSRGRVYALALKLRKAPSTR